MCQTLEDRDLSYNGFTGDLPSSFGSLTNLTRLFLQNNKFTGSVIYLSNLPLEDLNIQDNSFSGVIPSHFESIHNLLIGGNRFQVGVNYPPWNFPLDKVPSGQNSRSPPKSESSAIENYPSHMNGGQQKKKKRVGPGGIAAMVCGGTLLVSCAALIFGIRIRRSRMQKLNNSLQLSAAGGIEYFCAAPEESPLVLPIRSIVEKTTRRRSFSKKYTMHVSAKTYTVAELESATKGFSKKNLLGEGSLGSVYRAEFTDGQFVAVKNINTVSLSLEEQDQFLDVICLAARLRHPNIVTLLGYCIEHTQHLLVYEYIRNLSLDDVLHSKAYLPLSWGLRLQIALGVARALNYLHSTCSPPVAHSNLKAANILLDQELMPRISDCGLAVLRPLTSNSVKMKASEMAIGDTGYIVPEHVQHGVDSTKSDVYAFGVLLLELLTGRRPFDSLRPMEEQSLVKWASTRLHCSEALEQMVDPGIGRALSSRTLSQFADIVSLCIQPEKELRSPMSEVVKHLTILLQKAGTIKSITPNDTEVDTRSFRSTYTRFFSSPPAS